MVVFDSGVTVVQLNSHNEKELIQQTSESVGTFWKIFA